MALEYDARHARWRAAVIARQMQSGCPREEHLLLALLEQEPVVEALHACSANIGALKAKAETNAARYRFEPDTQVE